MLYINVKFQQHETKHYNNIDDYLDAISGINVLYLTINTITSYKNGISPSKLWFDTEVYVLHIVERAEITCMQRSVSSSMKHLFWNIFSKCWHSSFYACFESLEPIRKFSWKCRNKTTHPIEIPSNSY